MRSKVRARWEVYRERSRGPGRGKRSFLGFLGVFESFLGFLERSKSRKRSKKIVLGHFWSGESKRRLLGRKGSKRV